MFIEILSISLDRWRKRVLEETNWIILLSEFSLENYEMENLLHSLYLFIDVEKGGI